MIADIDGDGTFQPAQYYHVGISPIDAAGDFNGDGKLDIAAANYGNPGSVRSCSLSGSVSVLLNIGGNVSISGYVTLESLLASAPSQKVDFAFRPDNDTAAIFRTAMVGPTGGYNIGDLPNKNGTLLIKGSKWLAKSVRITTVGGNIGNVNAVLHGGDADNNNRVDFDDFIVFLYAFGSKLSDPASGCNSTADFNGDGQVDFNDFLILSGSFGAKGDN